MQLVMTYSPSAHKPLPVVPYIVRNNPFFSVDTHDWLLSKGYALQTIPSAADEYAMHIRAVSDYEYVNNFTGLKLGFVGNVVVICGWHEDWGDFGLDTWVEIWHFTNPMKPEAVRAIIEVYKNSL